MMMMMMMIAVPGSVQSLRVIGRGSYHVTLRWAAPTEPNGVLTGYIVGYRLGWCQRSHYIHASRSVHVVKYLRCMCCSLLPFSPHSSPVSSRSFCSFFAYPGSHHFCLSSYKVWRIYLSDCVMSCFIYYTEPLSYALLCHKI